MSLNKPLQQKIAQCKMVLEDALDNYAPENCLIAWSGGKDSTLLVKLSLEVCRLRGLTPPRVIDIDQDSQFDEIIAFRDRMVDEWGLDLLVARNHNVLAQVEKIGDTIEVSSLNQANQQALKDIDFSETHFPWIPDSPVCNHLLKTLPFNQAISEHAISAMYTGIRWDEHAARANETYFSTRETPAHMRIHPLLHVTERDIWDIHFGLDIPFNDLYKAGYRSIGSKHGTQLFASVPAWEQDLENTSERGGRPKEKEKVMEQLRAWGYM